MRHNPFNRALAGILLFAVCESLPAANRGYVTASGTRFMLNGRPHYVAGANFWQGMNLGMHATNGGDRARLGRELDRLQALGVNNLRVVSASEGPDGEPYRMAPALQPATGVFNEAVFEGLDYLLDAMDQRDMRAVMQLNNYWHWSGGMAQYVSWAEGTSIPYPNDTDDWWTFMLYSARFYTNAVCQAAYQAAISTVLNRTNTLTGIRYADDPTVFAWQLANEPRMYPTNWIDDTAAYIKSIDTNHMVSTGSEGQPFGGDFMTTHDGPDIDYTTCHIWPQNWGWYDPAVPSSLIVAISNALLYLDTNAVMAATLNKPLVLDEFGLARDRTSPLFDEYDPAAPTSARDDFYEVMYTAVFSNALAGGALAGDNAWAWGGEGRPTNPAPRWIGDPPHEIPGWYSVYDVDTSTLTVISNHAAMMTLLAYDNDYDRLPDDWEIIHFGSITNSAGGTNDWDHDLFIDYHEYIADTDPQNPSNYFVIQSAEWNQALPCTVISWQSATGRLYTVTTTTNLDYELSAVAEFTEIPGTGDTMTYTNYGPFFVPWFQRVEVQLAP